MSARLGAGSGRHPDRAQPFALGAPASVPAVESLGALLAHWAALRGDRPCAYFIDLQDNIQSLTFAALFERAQRWSANLVALGVRAGDRVVLALPTGDELLSA